MRVRRIANRAADSVGSKGRQPKPNRTGWFALVVLSAGMLAGVAALLGIGPFSGTRALVASIVHPAAPGQLSAEAVFPPVHPIHQVVDVYDPPPPAAVRPVAPAPPAGRPSQTTGPYPVINFPEGPMSAIEATCEAAKQAAQNQSSAYQQNVEQQCEAAKQAYERAHP